MRRKISTSQALFESFAGVRAGAALDHTILNPNAIGGENEHVLEDSALIPLYAAALSVIVLALHGISRIHAIKKLISRLRYSENPPRREGRDPPIAIPATTFIGELKEHIQEHGGLSIFIWNVLRLGACLALLGLTIYAAVMAPGPGATPSAYLDFGVDGHKKWSKHGKKKHPKHQYSGHRLSYEELVEIALCIFYAYASLLALVTLLSRKNVTSIISKHLTTILAVAFGVFAWRDIYPLATYVESPVDAAGGWLSWSRVGLLSFAGAAVPLLIPFRYFPLDPSNRTPHPEQTASLLSFITFSFMYPIVLKAYRVPHLAYEELPPLADYDHAKYLVGTSFPVLEPSQKPVKGRHLFFGLMWIYRWQYTILAILCCLRAGSTLAGPVAINHILQYLETGGSDAVVRPWVWCLLLFLSPTASSVFWHIYIFYSTRNVVQTEAIITQLVFHHALKIRMLGDAKSDSPSKAGTTATSEVSTITHTPGENLASRPEEGGDHSAESSETTTVQASGNGVPTGKGKAKADTVMFSEGFAAPIKADTVQEAESANLVGKISNLVSSDLDNLVDGRDFLWILILAPMQICLSIWFLYTILGWSTFVGMASMLVTFPFPGLIAKVLNSVQKELMKRTDARVQAVTDTINIVRMIKLFGWEKKIEKRIDEKREAELILVKRKFLYNIANRLLNNGLPLLTMVATFAAYTLIMKEDLTASRIFSSIAAFDMIREQLVLVARKIPQMISAKVSIDRVDDFLHNTELLDCFTHPASAPNMTVLPPPAKPNDIGFRNATFAWRAETPGLAMTPARRNFRLCVEGDLLFKKGKFNAIIGPTGSGKTSLLMALLGEMHYVPTTIDSHFNLPRSEGVAYAAQEAWILNATIKDNILFGQPFDEERYAKVLHQCALERDLTLFEAGDATEIGEKGVTLSGGQKARVSLARAVYSPAQTVLLDDVLSALDVHTSKWVIDECFNGDLLHGRTILLVTHNIAMIAPISDFIVSVKRGGRVIIQDSTAEALLKDPSLFAEAKKSKEVDKKEAEVIDPPEEKPKKSGHLIEKEEVNVGRIGLPAFMFFFSAFGGFLFWFTFLAALTISRIFQILETWWLGYWAKQYTDQDSAPVNVSFYMGCYFGIVLVGWGIYNPGWVLFLFGAMRGCREIHKHLLHSILGTTLRWLDTTPSGRITARFTQDIRAADTSLAMQLGDILDMFVSMILKFGAVLIYSPVFAIPGAGLAGFGAWLGHVYVKAQLSVKREMSNAKSPVYSHFSAAMAGLTSIRAYGAEEKFEVESMQKIDHYVRPARTFYNMNRWISVRIDALGSLFSASLAAYLVYGRKVDSSTVGFSLSVALSFSSMLLWIVRFGNDFEAAGNSIERIKGYVEIEQEPEATEVGEPPAYWPSSGSLVVEKLSARYSENGPDVLHDISFEIKSGEHVGVVGRTGAGKSSLSLALLRMIPSRGMVTFDGIDIKTINLNALRSNITTIPQQPELITGTLRYNLDPFQEHDDATLNSCLRSAGLFDLQKDDDEDRITLETKIASGGSNFSLGQRQIIALARAMVRRSKIYLLDEATASVDYKTDTAIQEVIATEFNETTLIIVAHRLQTIMTADKILVLDAGRVVEFDSPQNLLRKNGMFKGLVDGSGDRDLLYEMSSKKGKASSQA